MQLRSLALPFTVLEWSLPTVPRPSSKDHTAVSAETSSPKASPLDSMCATYAGRAILIAESGIDGSQDEFSETFSFALVNGALGVFEVHGRRIRDFRYAYLLKYKLQNLTDFLP
nr:WD repeat-containing protein 11 isoform X1 [Ipomoea trifida]